MKNEIMRLSARVLPPLTLLEWGAILTYFYCSGRLSFFLHPVFRPLVLFTGILLLLSAGCVLWFGGSEFTHDCGNAGCSHVQPQQTPWRLLAFAMLLFPIAAAALLSPDTFSAAFIQNRGISQSMAGAPSTSAFLSMQGNASELSATPATRSESPAPGGAPRAVSLFDLIIAAQDNLSQKDFDGKRVALTGRFYPGDDHCFGLVCTLITCCALDAQTLAVRVNTAARPEFEKLTWVKVVGQVSFAKDGEENVPIITAEQVTAIPTPKDPYIYRPARPSRRHRPAHF